PHGPALHLATAASHGQGVAAGPGGTELAVGSEGGAAGTEGGGAGTEGGAAGTEGGAAGTEGGAARQTNAAGRPPGYSAPEAAAFAGPPGSPGYPGRQAGPAYPGQAGIPLSQLDMGSFFEILIPVKSWLHDRGWRQGIRLLIIPYALLPLIF